MDRMEDQIEKFEAITEGGELFTIICFERIITTNALIPSSQSNLRGTIRYETICGLSVNACKDPNQFEIVQTDQVVRRTLPIPTSN